MADEEMVEYVAASQLNWRMPWVVTLAGEIVPSAYAVERGLDGYPCYNVRMARAVARALVMGTRAADATWLAWVQEVRDDLAAGRTPSAWEERLGYFRRDGYSRAQLQAILAAEERERTRRRRRGAGGGR